MTATCTNAAPVDPVAMLVTELGMRVGHWLGDFCVQRDQDAQRKGDAGATGRRACARHVVTYSATQLTAVAALAALTGVRLRPGAVLAGTVVSAGTHYIADRRPLFKKLVTRIGGGDFHALGQPAPGQPPHLGTGAHALDQAWHHVFNASAAAVMAVGARRR